MIVTAEEFRDWCDDRDRLGRHRALKESAPLDVLLEVVERFPEWRDYVASSRNASLELLELLRRDDDAGVREVTRGNPRWGEAHPQDYSFTEHVDIARARDATELRWYRLTDDDRRALTRGLWQWGGNAYATEELAVAIGFASEVALREEGDRIAQTIKRGDQLSMLDWMRALLATEVGFISSGCGLGGSGSVWSTVADLDDQVTLRILRRLQERFSTGPWVVGKVFGTLHSRY